MCCLNTDLPSIMPGLGCMGDVSAADLICCTMLSTSGVILPVLQASCGRHMVVTCSALWRHWLVEHVVPHGLLGNPRLWHHASLYLFGSLVEADRQLT